MAAFALFASPLSAETVTLTLKQAVEIALRENPDIALARIDEQRAAMSVRLMKDLFSPKVTAGSGGAYTNGYPLSVEGSGPSVLQAVASQFLLTSGRIIWSHRPRKMRAERGGQQDRKATRWPIASYLCISMRTVPAASAMPPHEKSGSSRKSLERSPRASKKAKNSRSKIVAQK